MPKTVRSAERRADALTRERIVDVAIELLDAAGEPGLTFRALATRLGTGHGAIQWHVASKSELLEAATAVAVARAVADLDPDTPPRAAIHAVALDVFDAIEAHPWIGGQLAHAPWQSAMLEIFERIGRQVRALGVPAAARFTAASALLNYIIGVGGQNATNSRSPEASGGRQEFLDVLARRWAELDAEGYAFTRTVVEQLRVHDDRVEFLAGIDLILTGMTATEATRRR
jgi:AcrR family transcriptional regulator